MGLDAASAVWTACAGEGDVWNAKDAGDAFGSRAGAVVLFAAIGLEEDGTEVEMAGGEDGPEAWV